ncbi:MAG: 30S ribosome-binding factor RbfA [Bacteroidales bacterium]|nr:30S ribosome-binding factor RbfA [Bacteroidales bacterium]MBQ2397848.1 30S ribosome-binding factor RbfA [Bacteroidales bacterium]MBQ5890985.1 30S ribosome-binding factor RbfA [Bacteroidales bacterium]MEE0267134.1 30S ribosome-binding factor RbfA [Bacteroidales bacterium]MEE1271577.1 30S ribosome-binding factor RbfA [Bacteroidales bacterium]
MDNNRLQKVARLIQKDMGEILRYESKNLFKGAMITVTRVRVSSDLSIAKIYISIFALSGVTTDEVFELVKANKPLLRNKLASMERNQLRIIPDLSFFVDDSLDYSENIDRLLKS